MHWESSGVLSGIFEELALQPAGSRAQDAIKRLDCGTQPMGLWVMNLSDLRSFGLAVLGSVTSDPRLGPNF